MKMKSKRIRPLAGGSVGWRVVPYTKRLWVRFLDRGRTGGKQLVFASHINLSLSSFLSKIDEHPLG